MKKAVRDHEQNQNAGIHRRQLLRTTALIADAALLINPVLVNPFHQLYLLGSDSVSIRNVQVAERQASQKAASENDDPPRPSPPPFFFFSAR